MSFRAQVDFRFDGYPIADLRLFVFSTRQSSTLPTPPKRLGYLNLADMEQYRKTQLFGPPPPIGFEYQPNPPAARRRVKLLRALVPEDPCQDPYIAGVLIALAQEQRFTERGSTNGNGSLGSAASSAPLQTLVASGPRDHEWLYIYTSKVSPEFLDRLDYPSRPPPASAQSQLGMVIHRRKLAFKPYGTLQKRLTSVIQDATSGKH